MIITDLDFVQGFIRMASDGFALGWHERNGGNLSYRMKAEEVEQAKEYFDSRRSFLPVGISAPNLGAEFFLVTGSGKFMRNVALQPADNLCIVELDRRGENYRIVWGLEKGGVPTSELPTHIMNHSVKKTIKNAEQRVIYHAHTTNLIALTFILPLDDKTFSHVLWTMATECPVVFPEGVGVVPWMVPGSREIALATCELMKKYNVAIWAHHGTFCSGPDFDTTFGLMHTVEKSAEIYLKVVSAGKIMQSITDQNLRNLAKAFNVSLREEFLD
jgi:rhamnulose-1-phosphate aldolase